ncbi:PilW family protein [Stutzerimonas kirkiae]|uniref:Type IV pilus assembly protein PilW n=1 Tax=Stutzerimonas kirkiae TaxID=2211392 RepID=A0A4Q9RB14_9GAMM|nr:hypothetical protein [Stutzerimonas kirkiae]TBU97364.1 hypothetical protein DNJ96_08680 [Stutzerimonas kirkiae]TBV00339.1 hypothetical protein DNJ95_15030 [Stutzerimonas kirkiae]TBV05535.1 hypothetical protein DNK08_15875 [Stutzerimonas kirkiae]
MPGPTRLQGGLSLAELLLGMAIGSALLLGLSLFYIDNRRHYLFLQSQLENLENARHAFLLLEQEVSRAGYRRQPDQPYEIAFGPQQFGAAGKLCDLEQGQVFKYIDDSSFCLRYQPALPDSYSCDGKPIDAIPATPYTTHPGAPVIALFSADRQTRELRCNGDAIVHDLEHIRFEYAVADTAAAGSQHYTDTPGPSQAISAIRYLACLASTREVRRDTAPRPEDCPGPADRRLYASFGNGIALRNHRP